MIVRPARASVGQIPRTQGTAHTTVAKSRIAIHIRAAGDRRARGAHGRFGAGYVGAERALGRRRMAAGLAARRSWGIDFNMGGFGCMRLAAARLERHEEAGSAAKYGERP